MVWLGLTALIINVLITYTSGTNATLNNTLTSDNQCNAKPLCKNLLEQFNLLTNELIATKKYFTLKSTNNLSVRGKETPLKTREQCKVSRDKMIALRNVVNKALAKPTNKSSEEVTCEVDLVTDNSTSCAELIDFVRCGVDHLTQGILNTTSSENYKEYQKWKTAYDELFKEYEKTIDNVKQNLTQESKRQLDTLIKRLQESELQFKKTNKLLKDERISLIVSELDSEKIDSAFGKFANFGDDSTVIPEIVSRTYYNYTKKNNAMIIATFIDRLLYLTQKEIGFRKLLEVLEAKRDTNSYSILYIYFKVDTMLAAKNPEFKVDPTSYQNLVKTKEKLKPHVDNIIDLWANEMRTNKEDGTMPNVSNIYHDTFYLMYHLYAHQLVEKAFLKDMRNVINIVRFARKLRTYTLRVLTVSELLNLIQKHGHLDDSIELFAVARFVKDLLHDLEKEYPGDWLISELEKTMMKIPYTIVDLTWSGNRCAIRNVYTSEYLYSPERHFNFANTERRYAFTWMPKVDEGTDKFRWELIAADDVDFKIKNVEFHEYLYGSVYDIVFTYMTGGSALPNSNWVLIPHDKYFLIKCRQNGRYIQPASSSLSGSNDNAKIFSDRRNVYLPDNIKIVERMLNANMTFSIEFGTPINKFFSIFGLSVSGITIHDLDTYLWDVYCRPELYFDLAIKQGKLKPDPIDRTVGLR